jgi:hypothetical protein
MGLILKWWPQNPFSVIYKLDHIDSYMIVTSYKLAKNQFTSLRLTVKPLNSFKTMSFH